ncbi:MAG TPA: hypothetical protein VJR89_09180 [Polyangiales bacterium]|nr:hypothetical protein [Polyangiales bacterium]
MRLWWAVLVVLHAALFVGLYQSGFTRQEVQALVPPGPYKLTEPYVRAAQRFGPASIVRVYFAGQGDERLYLEYARLLLEGRIDLGYIQHIQKRKPAATTLPPRPWPYRDVTVEYPPLAFLAFVPPALISTDYAVYRHTFAAWMLILHFLNLALAWRLVAPREAASRMPPVWLGWASLAFCVLLGRILATRMDHLAVTWALLCVAAGARALQPGAARLRWVALAGVLGAAGVMTKLVPGLAFFAVLLACLQTRAADRLRLAAVGCGAAGLALLAINLPVIAWSGARYLESFRYHALRGVQLESVYAGLLLVARGFGLPARIEESFGSANLDTCLTDVVQQLSVWLLLLAIALICARRWPPTARGLTLWTSALLLGYMLTSRVFSPQYLIWIGAPLLAAGAHDPPRGTFRKLAALLSCAALLSQLIYPQGYPVLKAFHPLAIALLNLRNALLVFLLVWIVRAASEPLQRNT